ncbi:DnaJ (Hsp40), sub C, member 17, partial [Spiromyces aspiralis]
MESEEFDYYEVLGVAIESTAKDISKAYRQKALKYHPDKNPDNAELIKLFHQIKKAHEILTNPQERAAYDEKRKAKVQQIRKRQQMGQARQKMKDELEANERLAKQRQQEAREAKWRAEMEAEKFRAEAARAEQRREAMMQREIKRQMKAAADAAQEQMQHEESDELERSVRVRWDRSRVYMKDELERIFKQFGELEEVVVVASSARTTTTSSSSSALMVYSTV